MEQETQITIKLTNEELDIIKKASELCGLGHTTYTRSATLKEARKHIKELA